MNSKKRTKVVRALPPSEALVLTVEELCAVYRVSKNRVFDELREGRLPAKRIGSRVLISREDAQAWWNALPNRLVGANV